MRFLSVIVALAVSVVLGAPAAAAEDTTTLGPFYGWRWAETVEVFDATKGKARRNAQVAEAVREWDATDVDIRMTKDRATANIVVEVRDGACSGACVTFPALTDGVASGVCNVIISTQVSRIPSIMHPMTSPTGFLTEPQPVDLRTVDHLY